MYCFLQTNERFIPSFWLWKVFCNEARILYNFSRFLKNVPIEKWVINFYQFELFPDIMINGSNMRRITALVGQWQASLNPEPMTFARIISRQLVELQQDLSIAKDFPAEEVATAEPEVIGEKKLPPDTEEDGDQKASK